MHWLKIDELYKKIRNQMGPSIISMIVHGPVARGENSDESCVDLLLLLRDPSDCYTTGQLEKIITSKGPDVGPAVNIHALHFEEFIALIGKSDPSVITIAREGHCLFQSTVFQNAKRLVLKRH